MDDSGWMDHHRHTRGDVWASDRYKIAAGGGLRRRTDPALGWVSMLNAALLASGIGSLLTQRLAGESKLTTGSVLQLLLVVTLVILGALTPLITGSFAASTTPVRVLVAVGLLFPMGVWMGMPFPIGLRAVQRSAPQLVPWSWAVNGFFTVIGSVVAVVLGMTIGFTGALVLAGACYAVALLAGWAPAVQVSLKTEPT